MSKRGPQGRGSEARIKSFIANTIANRPDEIRSKRGEISSTVIARLYEEETGEKVTRQTVAKYIADKDFINYTQASIPESNTRMQEIDKRIATALSISDNENAKDGDRCKALNTYKGLIKFKTDYEAGLRADKLRQADVERPTHLTVLCMPPAVVICPKCEHGFLIDNSKADKKHLDAWLKEHKHNIAEDAKHIYKFHNTLTEKNDNVEKTDKKKEFKSGKGQSTIYNYKKGDKNEQRKISNFKTLC